MATPAVHVRPLTPAAFDQLAGRLGGYRYVKVVVERVPEEVHFLDSAEYDLHVKYIADRIIGMPREELERTLDAFNASVYRAEDRRFYLGTLALHRSEDGQFLSLETTEADTMPAEMIRHFYRVVREHVDSALPLLFKPANHEQEQELSRVSPADVPRIMAHELYSMARFVPLNPGSSRGRLRVLPDDASYQAARDTLEWHDIIVMDRVPEDVPRVSGFINTQRTTPLSHTNILASGWGIPNAIQLDAGAAVQDGQWVEYTVDPDATEVGLRPIEPGDVSPPGWRVNLIQLSEPDTDATPIARLDQLTAQDHLRYGTKAANLGELGYVLAHGSERLLGFYQVPRPPRPNLLGHLAGLLETGSDRADELSDAANALLRKLIEVPRGIALPFAIQRQFLESSAAIQQTIGKLKMALELDAPCVDAICLTLQQLIRSAPLPAHLRRRIEEAVGEHLGGVSGFVLRSSSNAEDLAGFSAAGIYESVNHVRTSERLVDGVKQVWASLLSPRSVRLRQQVGIPLDDCYMGVIIQEEVSAPLGGVLVTANPTSAGDFRNVYVNVSRGSVIDVVSGQTAPLQYLFSTVEGGGRTLSLGDAGADLAQEDRDLLQRLALAGRLLQSHFSPDYAYDQALDIEWLAGHGTVRLLQLRPY